ncbi:transposase [Candidatus Megaera polyxenophila]|uniref:transposase n=1 Tax=Candidatus Megaera polyxenophila TaxID=988779 RepID=UPI00397750F5
MTFSSQLAARRMSSSFFAKDGMLKELTKNLFERALQAEIDEHLGYSKYGRAET